MSSTSSASETGPSPTRRGWIIALIVAITIGGGAALAFWPGSKPNADLASGLPAPANGPAESVEPPSTIALLEAAPANTPSNNQATNEPPSEPTTASNEPDTEHDHSGLPAGHPELASVSANQTSIQWLGHACFYIHTPGGNTVVTDPFDAAATGYESPATGSHYVTISTDRPQHRQASVIHAFQEEGAKVEVLRGIDGGRGDLKIRAIRTSGRGGRNTAYLIQAGALRILHLGAINKPLSSTQIKGIGPIDVLMIPVGGYYVLDGPAAAKVAKALNPKVVLPMAYRTSATAPSLAQSLQQREPFIAATDYAVTTKTTDIFMVSPADLPDSTEIWSMRYSH